MKIRHIRAWLALVPLLFSMSALAEMKLAWLSPSQALLESDEAKEWQEMVKGELQPEQDKLQKIQDQIKALQEKATQDAEVMTDSEKQSLSEEVAGLQRDIQYNAEKLEQSVQAKQRDFHRALQPKLRAVVDDLIQLEGYDAIFDLDIFPNSGGKSATIYVNPKHDITRKVTELLNEKASAE